MTISRTRVVLVAVALGTALLAGCTAQTSPPPAPTATAAAPQTSTAPTPTATPTPAPALSRQAAWDACIAAIHAKTGAATNAGWDTIDQATFTENGGLVTIALTIENGTTLNPDGSTTPIRAPAGCVVSGTTAAPVVESAFVDDRG
jgi:hypothetical protein